MVSAMVLCRLQIQMSLEAFEHGADGVWVAAEVVEKGREALDGYPSPPPWQPLGALCGYNPRGFPQYALSAGLVYNKT